MNARFLLLAAAAFAGAAVSLAVSAAAAPAPAGLKRHRIDVNGMERTYLPIRPAQSNPQFPAGVRLPPLESGDDGETMRRFTGRQFDRLAIANRFVVVYPDGWERTWNDCRKESSQPARRANIDDKSFIDAMIEKQVIDNRIDRRRVFATGWSTGGQLAYRLAMERPTQFAGVAAISASLPTTQNNACTPTEQPIAVMVVNGTADPINPHEGGEVRIGISSLGSVLSSVDTARYFARVNGIMMLPATTRLPERKWCRSHVGQPGVVVRARQTPGDALRHQRGRPRHPAALLPVRLRPDAGSGRPHGDLGLFLETTGRGIVISGSQVQVLLRPLFWDVHRKFKSSRTM